MLYLNGYLPVAAVDDEVKYSSSADFDLKILKTDRQMR